MDTMQATIDVMSSAINKRMEEFEAKLQKTPNASTSLPSLAAEFNDFRVFVTQVLKNLQRQVEALAVTVDGMEMQRRRKILLLHGVDEVNEENPTHTVLNIINQQLGLADFSACSIRRCQRMGRATSSKKPRPLLFKLQDLGSRDKLWLNKTKLKGSGITMSEFLTKSRHDVFMAARERFGITKSWTKDGNVYIIGPDEVRHRVASLAELNSLAEMKSKSNTVAPKATKSKRAATVKK